MSNHACPLTLGEVLALTAAQNAEPGEGWLGDVLGLEEA